MPIPSVDYLETDRSFLIHSTPSSLYARNYGLLAGTSKWTTCERITASVPRPVHWQVIDPLTGRVRPPG